MKLNEKLFEFAVNREIYDYVQNIDITSQREEAKYGYDSMFNTNEKLNEVLKLNKKIKVILVQYKIPKEVNTKNKRISNYSKINHLPWNSDFVFMFYPNYKKHGDLYYYNQHNVLKEMSQDKGVVSLYCIPSFLSKKELYYYLRANSVIDNSIFININTLPKLEPKDYIHKKYVDKSGVPRKLCSFEYETSYDEFNLKTLINILNNTEPISLQEFSVKVLNAEKKYYGFSDELYSYLNKEKTTYDMLVHNIDFLKKNKIATIFKIDD